MFLKVKFLLLIFIPLLSLRLFPQAIDYTQYVNPIIGTKGILIYGRTTPFVTPPFGMTDWTPINFKFGICLPMYNYGWLKIIGFRGSHKPAMCMGDYGYVSIMPVAGEKGKNKPNHSAWFSHRHEKAKPYYYSVRLNNSLPRKKVVVEITSSVHVGLFRIAFPKKTTHYLFVEASREGGGWVKIDTVKNELIGYNTDIQSQSISPPLPHFKGYFAIHFSAPVKTFAAWSHDTMFDNKAEQSGLFSGARLSFDADTVMVKTGTSFISPDQARQNMEKEIPAWDFAAVEQASKNEWNEYLSRLQIEPQKPRDLHIFYTSMYHSLLFPRQFSEHGHYYSAFDDQVHEGVSYNDYSLWDTYRAEHPLLLFIAPERVPVMLQSLLQMYREGGWMPKWPNPSYTGIMIGTHADAVMADAIVKGVRGFDWQLAYKACLKDAMVPPDGDSVKRWQDRAPWTSYEARAGLSWYKKLGYVPVDKTAESVSNTLEGAYDDFCVAQVAKAVGEMGTYNELMKRSENYHNVYNAQTGFMAPKKADGSWGENPQDGFTEGKPYTYLFCAAQNIPGLIQLLGGRDAFIQKLDRMFAKGQYVHENEPGHNYTYLYDYAGAAWKTQLRVAHYRHAKYRDSAQGLNGDDDCGQMSAWYIFSALGFYPVTPGTDVYALGTPLFPKATLYFDPEHRDKKFEVRADNVSPRNIYVQSAYLNGVELKEPFIHHADIVNGGILLFKMGPKPKKDW